MITQVYVFLGLGRWQPKPRTAGTAVHAHRHTHKASEKSLRLRKAHHAFRKSLASEVQDALPFVTGNMLNNLVCSGQLVMEMKSAETQSG